MSPRRRGRGWMADYRDASGRRVRKAGLTREEARGMEDHGHREAHSFRGIPNPTLSEYAEAWLARKRPFVKPATYKAYEMHLRVHIRPELGSVPLRSLSRADVKGFLGRRLEAGLDRLSVGTILGTLRSLLSEAREDGIIETHPAAALGRRLKLWPDARTRTDRIRAMTPEQVRAFLEAAEMPFHPLFLTMALTGLRISEALGLEWTDIDLERREARVRQKWSDEREIETPKSGHGRTIDLAEAACESLMAHRAATSAEWAAKPPPGPDEPKSDVPRWVFFDRRTCEPWDHEQVRDAFKRAAAMAGLTGYRFSPKSLRHTYASQMLSMGWSPAYVQEQLGHATIELTVTTYGRWLRKRAPGAVDMLSQAFSQRAPIGHAEAVEALMGVQRGLVG